jgi:hypothetical protein
MNPLDLLLALPLFAGVVALCWLAVRREARGR